MGLTSPSCDVEQAYQLEMVWTGDYIQDYFSDGVGTDTAAAPSVDMDILWVYMRVSLKRCLWERWYLLVVYQEHVVVFRRGDVRWCRRCR